MLRLILLGALLFGALLIAPMLMVSGFGNVSLLLDVLAAGLLGFIAGRRLSTGAALALVVAAVLLSAAGGWWAGDQYHWAGGGLRSEHPLGYSQTDSGLYPHINALFRGALVMVVGLLAWGVGRRWRHS